MIEVEKVSRCFGPFRAVDDISFSVRKGEIVGLLGPNGAGKTTTMRMITGFLVPTSGSIKIDGIDIETDPESSKRKIGYMPESAPLYSDMIVEDYLRYVADMQGVDPESKVPQLAKTCGLCEVMHKNIGDLSRGYRQRVGLAHSLMHDPEILILDEPTSGLDPNQIIEVRNLIKEIGRTRTVIISTHILSEVEMLCDRVIIISRGRIVADSPRDELRKRYGHRANVRVQLAGCRYEDFARAAESVEGVAGVSQAEGDDGLVAALLSVDGSSAGGGSNAAGADSASGDIRPAVFELVKKSGWTLYEMSMERNSLEDVFRSLTVGGDEQ
jgi:ABC-2 type transport system ATP-binding protein